MRSLTKYVLDNNKASSYFKDHLEGGNTLSEELLSEIDFKTGAFFTLLPDKINAQYLYNFRGGYILPRHPYKVIEDSNEYVVQGVENIKPELGQIIFQLLNTSDYSCIFEEVLKSTNSPHLELFKTNGLLYKQEIYYNIRKDSVKENQVVDFIYESDVVWHFVCIITDVIIQAGKDHLISLDDIKAICSHVKLIIVGAYDGEGYLFWEPNS